MIIEDDFCQFSVKPYVMCAHQNCLTMLWFLIRITLTRLLITKTYLYDFDPLKPHFYIVKLGFTGVYIIFVISAQKHRLWYSLEPPR